MQAILERVFSKRASDQRAKRATLAEMLKDLSENKDVETNQLADLMEEAGMFGYRWDPGIPALQDTPEIAAEKDADRRAELRLQRWVSLIRERKANWQMLQIAKRNQAEYQARQAECEAARIERQRMLEEFDARHAASFDRCNELSGFSQGDPSLENMLSATCLDAGLLEREAAATSEMQRVGRAIKEHEEASKNFEMWSRSLERLEKEHAKATGIWATIDRANPLRTSDQSEATRRLKELPKLIAEAKHHVWLSSRGAEQHKELIKRLAELRQELSKIAELKLQP